MDEIYIRYITTTGLERTAGFRTDVEEISLDLRDMESVDLLPLIWCVKMKTLNIRNNRLTTIDLTPLSRCVNLEALRLNNNLLSEINLTPLSDCPHMQEVDIRGNKIR
ncbi:MAG: leucine-rich repeat domain-containing protein, partial [Candidatus Thorarchaeota archaeon]